MRSLKIRSLLFPVGYFAANAIYQGYTSLYYTSLGLRSDQLGAIQAATAAAALIAQPFWGGLGDGAHSRRRLLSLLCLSAALVLPAALLKHSFIWQASVAALFYAFFCALLPLGDTILLENDAAFGAYRLAGGISFALIGAGFGAISGSYDAAASIVLTSALLLLTALAARRMPEAKRPRAAGSSVRLSRAWVGMLSLLKERRLRRMLLFMLPIQMSMGFFYTFYAPQFTSLSGGTGALLGLGYLISAACEAPYLLLSRRIYRRFGAELPMFVSALLLAARWFLLSRAKTAMTALVSQTLHGGGFIVISVSMAYWISEHVPEDKKASGQGLINLVSFGIARIPGNLLGGMLAQRFGRNNAFLAGAAICLLACLVFLPNAYRASKRLRLQPERGR